MNLAQAIHQRWAEAVELGQLLPADRVFTGLAVDAPRPLAVLARRSGRPAARFGDGSSVDLVVVRIEIVDDDYDRAAAILHQVKAAFDRSAFALAGADRVLAMRRADDAERQDDDGTWRVAIDFECHVLLASGI